MTIKEKVDMFHVHLIEHFFKLNDLSQETLLMQIGVTDYVDQILFMKLLKERYRKMNDNDNVSDIDIFS